MPRHHMYSLTRIALAIALFIAVPAVARAQGTGRSMDIDLSIAAAAMGEASTAVSWGDLNYWSNPALLGYAQGIRYIHTHTQLVPGLATDVFFNTDAVRIGAGGVGAVFSGKPWDKGGVRLDYGLSEGRDENGNFTGSFNSWETVKSFGLGISVAHTLETAMHHVGMRGIDVSRYADVSLGMNWKDVDIVLAPAAVGGHGATSARDRGIHARLTPVDGFRSRSAFPVRVDLAYGASVQSYNDDAMVTFINVDQPSPVTRAHRRGAAGRLCAGRLWVPPHRAGELHRALIEGLTPLVTMCYASDRDDIGALDEIMYQTRGSGFELTLANVVTYRHGHYEDLEGQIDGDTWGWGVGLPLGTFAGFRYDDAHIPQAMNSGLGDVHRSQYTVWIDPIAIWSATRTRD